MASTSDERDRGRGDAGPEERRAPLAATVGLVIGFLALLVIGVVTVVVPEITDDGEHEAGESAAPAADAEPGAPAR